MLFGFLFGDFGVELDFLFSFRVFLFCLGVGFFCLVYLKFVYDFSVVLNVLRVERYRLDYWMVRWVKELIGRSGSQSGNPWYKG